jgi:hypothetical protein
MSSDDALGLFQAMRPQAPGLSTDIRAARGGLPGTPDLHSLAMVPGTPGYTERIPRPPCYKCGEDHLPNHDYGHAWQSEPIHDEPVTASAIMRRPAPEDSIAQQGFIPSTARRVVLYVGRGDTYVLAVEEAPDWEAVHTFKVEPYLVLPLVRMARALDTKVMDKTGGDLLMLEQENDDGGRKSAQNHDGSAEGAGDRQPRRQGSDAHREEEHQSG